MKLRSLLRAAIIALCASLLFFVNRPTTHHLLHPYPAPEFELRNLKGNQASLSECRGKAVVLNFWATWCAPCRRELPWFVEFQKEYGPRGLQIIGVSMDDGGINAIAPFVRENGHCLCRSSGRQPRQLSLWRACGSADNLLHLST
jgi:thiol-disulfide isomerase/thioredoxin